MTNKLLYIGLNGFAGSGKDTVAKMIKTILNYNWANLEACKSYYNSIYTNPTISATHNNIEDNTNKPVLSIAFADQLKHVCANIFGIPVERFYQNKETAWICINQDFKYTELKPDDEHLVTADDYYYNLSKYKESETRYWMSLREILVYVGTYVLQQDINKRIFVNVVRNTVHNYTFENPNLQYVIVTDIRFQHEIDFIRENNGITITITRDDVQQLNNVAEHDLDYMEDWDYTIENNSTYDELFERVWNLLHNNLEFHNKIVDLQTREDYVDNYLRLIENRAGETVYKLCSPFEIKKLYRSEGTITMLDPIGGPTITVGSPIPGTGVNGLVPKSIDFDDITGKFLITIDDLFWNAPEE
jgi:hypothetical protein